MVLQNSCLPAQIASVKLLYIFLFITLIFDCLLCQFNKITITIHDYRTLREEEYLNDTIIDFYLSYLYETILPAALKNDVHIYSSHFYSRIKGSESSAKSSADKKTQSAI